jgi:DNA-binding MarR family transcriptional regulator
MMLRCLMMRYLSMFQGDFRMPSHDVSAAEVGQVYLELHHRVHRIVDQTMMAAGLSLARAKVLMRLREHGPMNQARLAGLLNFAPRSVTDILDALERDGLVSRADDQHDRRARVVSLTPAGREAYEAAQIARLKAMEEIFGSLTATERASLAGLLTTIRTTLESGEHSCE